RRRHTRFSRDWSSDVCSSDLLLDDLCQTRGFDAIIISGNDYRGHKGGVRWVSDYNMHHRSAHAVKIPGQPASVVVSGNLAGARRSEERRGGKERRDRGGEDQW